MIVTNSGFVFFIGLCIASGALGSMHGNLIGWLIFGAGLMAWASSSAMLSYLDKKPNSVEDKDDS